MQTTATYFVNHQRAYRWPLSIYHQPMKDWLETSIRAIAGQRGPGQVKALNVGA